MLPQQIIRQAIVGQLPHGFKIPFCGYLHPAFEELNMNNHAVCVLPLSARLVLQWKARGCNIVIVSNKLQTTSTSLNVVYRGFNDNSQN